LKLKLIDKVIPEPLGGAHRDPTAAIQAVGDTLQTMLGQLIGTDPTTLKAQRRDKFIAMGGVLQSLLAG
jgi:acetyl-CoA carboxylase carboxyl transferase subunit alpha